jgi:5-carboxymethyl-2-hydroxymuconate isomerase
MGLTARSRSAMPHLVILYTPQLERETDMPALCRKLADTMLRIKDESGAQVFPTAGTRVLAYPAAHYAVADGSGDHAFIYFNVRMAQGRSAAVHRCVGETLAATVREELAPLLAQRPVGLTLQVDEGHEVFDAKLGNLHALFAAKKQ